MPDHIQLDDLLGIGTYSRIFTGKWNDQNVVIKQLHNIQDLHKNQEFWKEVERLKRIRYQHIIQLYDIEKYKEEYVIVMQYAEMGSLSNVLENSSIELDWGTKRRFFNEISNGLHYLHTHK